MKVRLINVDSKIPNLALMQISGWHKLQGDEVGFDIENPDKVYISCVFSKNRTQALGIGRMFPGAELSFGGSGINYDWLPKDMQKVKPDYDLYPSEFSQGFTTRGCIRNCGFCIVPKKEGGIHIWQHPRDFHDERFDTCMIMDNNLFAAPQNWQNEVFRWFYENKIKMLSPQGWDVRLLTDERAGLLKTVRHSARVHFAWDNITDESKVESGIQMLKDAGFDLNHKISFYVLVGYNSTFEEDVYRCNKLREWGVATFVMPYKKNKQINALARWANRQFGYWKVPFSEYSRKKVRS